MRLLLRPTAPVLLALAAISCAAFYPSLVPARQAFARRFTCPPERVQVRRRPDVPPHVILGVRRAAPPPEVAADPARLRYFQQQHGADLAELDQSCAVFEASGCGFRVLECCTQADELSDAVCTNDSRSAATGELISTGPPAGVFTLQVVRCEAPDPADLSPGTVLVGRDGVRIAIAPSRASGFQALLLNLSEPRSREFVLSKEGIVYRCSELSGDARFTADGVSGSFRLRCETEGGSRIEGHLELSQCPTDRR